jgi:hypothetical protein
MKIFYTIGFSKNKKCPYKITVKDIINDIDKICYPKKHNLIVPVGCSWCERCKYFIKNSNIPFNIYGTFYVECSYPSLSRKIKTLKELIK